MRRYAATIGFALVALLGLAALLGAGASDERADGLPNAVPLDAPLATFRPGQLACQGVMQVDTRFAAIQAYLATTAAPGAGVAVRVLGAGSGAILARGVARPRFASTTIVNIPLDATVPAGRRISVCFRSLGPRPVALIGSTPVDPTIELTVAGRSTSSEAALTFLPPHPRSLLSLVPTMFDRAALFRPGWVGAWTFWLLAAGLLAAFVIGGLAVAQAARADTRSIERTNDQ